MAKSIFIDFFSRKIKKKQKLFFTTQKDCVVAFYLCTRILKALFETLISKKEIAMPQKRCRAVVIHQQPIVGAWKPAGFASSE